MKNIIYWPTLQDKSEGPGGDCLWGVGRAHPCLDQMGHSGAVLAEHISSASCGPPGSHLTCADCGKLLSAIRIAAARPSR